MGKKCGINDPEVDAAIDRASKFFGYYVDKGAIPYGEHEPWPYHENNGKNSLTAVFFAVQGDRPKETQFFAKMCTAAYKNREYGHTGQGFSYLWSTLGANTGGPDATAAFVKECSWHLDLSRRCDGSFNYDGGEQYGGGKPEGNSYYGKTSYCGLSPTASYVLAYSLPLKKLFITGRDASPKNWLSKREVADAVVSGRFDLERKTKSAEQLVAAFSDWSPIVRGWAAEELAKRPEAKTMVPRLIAMAEGRDVHVAQGACETLGFLKSEEAMPVLVRLLSHEDRWLRFKAAEAIKKMGGEAKPAVSDILQAVVQTAEPLQPIEWADAIQLTHGQLAVALFESGLTKSLKGTDRELLYPAIRALATNADGMARMRLKGFFENALTVEDVQALAPEIFAAVKTPSPADRMFANEFRMGAFRALTKYHFKEGIEAGVLFAKTQGGHGSENRTGVIMKEIAGYGSAARECMPELRELIDEFNAQCKRGEYPAGELNDRRTGAVKAAIKAIEAATTQPDLRFTAAAAAERRLEVVARTRWVVSLERDTPPHRRRSRPVHGRITETFRTLTHEAMLHENDFHRCPYGLHFCRSRPAGERPREPAGRSHRDLAKADSRQTGGADFRRCAGQSCDDCGSDLEVDGVRRLVLCLRLRFVQDAQGLVHDLATDEGAGS